MGDGSTLRSSVVGGRVFRLRYDESGLLAAFTERRSAAYAWSGALPVEAARRRGSPNAVSALMVMTTGAEMTSRRFPYMHFN